MLETESNQIVYEVFMLGLTQDSNVFCSYCGLKIFNHVLPSIFMIFASELIKLRASIEDDISVCAERR
jgi:hypothetical protein